MSVKWFAGAAERRDQALSVLDTLISDLNQDEKGRPLGQVLSRYRDELGEGETAAPLILRWMNIDVTKVLLASGLSLSASQEEQFKELRSLMQRRF